MQDEKKTKTELIRELEDTRRRLAELKGPDKSRDMLSFLQTLIDTIPSAIFYKDSQGVYRGCNKAYEDFLGLKQEDIVGKALHEVFPGDLADKYVEMDNELFRIPGKQAYEWQISAADGTRRDVIFNKATFANADGTLGGLVGVMVDITERKRAEKALLQAEERYRSIFENAVEGIFQSYPDGHILHVNPAHARMFGYDSPQEMIDAFEDIGQGHYVHPEDRQQFKEVCDTRGFIRGFEVEFYTKSGEIIWVSLNARTVKNAEGDILYYEGIAEDITKRKQAEKALQDSERLMSEIIDFLPDPTFAIDISGRVLVWNKAMEDMTGVKAQYMVGKGDYEHALPFYGVRRPMLADLLSRPDDAVESKYEFVKKDGDVILAEGGCLVNGNLRALWGKATFLYDSEGHVVGAIESIRDITRRREAEEELKKREQELLTKSRSLEEINIALKVLLSQREKDKGELEDSITLNVKKLVTPYIDKLKSSALAPREAAYVRFLEMYLIDIVSPFAGKLSSKLTALTAREIEIAKLVRDGKTTKEMADMLHTSIRAVEFHRDNIRRKLGLNKSNKNLRSYLLSLT